jgi:hypothetical protein
MSDADHARRRSTSRQPGVGGVEKKAAHIQATVEDVTEELFAREHLGE